MDEEKRREILKLLGLGSKEEAVAQSISNLTDREKIMMLSNLYPFEEEDIAILLLIADRYDVNFLFDFVDYLLTLRCSVGGERARQIVEIASEKRRESSRWGFLRFFRKKEEKGVEPYE